MTIPREAYEPSTWPRPLPRIARGVRGFMVSTEGTLWLVHIAAEHEGSGAVGRFLDNLPLRLRIVVPTVMNKRLAGMLERRGYAEQVLGRVEFSEPPLTGIVDTLTGYVRPARRARKHRV